MYCHKCGQLNNSSSSYCTNCGTKLYHNFETALQNHDVVTAEVTPPKKENNKTPIAPLVLSLIVIFACVGLWFSFGDTLFKNETKAPPVEKTVIIDDQVCYKIYINLDNIDRYFTLIPPKGQVAVSSVNFGGGPGIYESAKVVSHAAVAEGGWVAYYGGSVLYLPPEVDSDTIPIASARVIDFSPAECYTIEEAREFLPWLK